MNEYLEELLRKALAGIEEMPKHIEIILEKPKIAEHGDASTNVALMLAKPLKKAPRKIAELIVDRLQVDRKRISSVEIADPGFINFRFSTDFLYNELQKAYSTGSEIGKSNHLAGKKVLVEFVSANPTGPLTVGHGRNAVLGDTISRLLEWAGAEVQREYYFNDGGRQMRVLGESVAIRYQQLRGEDSEFPEDAYTGEYIIDIAKSILQEHGSNLDPEKDGALFLETAKKVIFADIEATLQRMNIFMDTFFNELTLYQNGAIDEIVDRLKQKNYVYESEGATWFKTSVLGKEKDTVLVKSTGEPTYRLPDMAYHIDKLNRGFDLALDVFGADHIATYPDVLSCLDVLGYDTNRVDVLIYQFVTLLKDGKPLKMSTRKANFITLDELMDEVGSDVTRFFFLMRSPGTHLDFDITEAKEASDKNPVFYLQYAHARIHSILRKAKEEGFFPATNHLEELEHEAEKALIKRIFEFSKQVIRTAEAREPHRLITFLTELAGEFHSFYHHCHILGEDPKRAQARLCLAQTVANVMKNGLTILGISAPERM